jgi:3-mercaptopropionate dioxygenase
MTTTTPQHTRPGLADLVTSIRDLATGSSDAHRTAVAVADLLRARPPTTRMLTPAELRGDDSGYRRHTLHTEADFSVVAVVWRPGQQTVIHDHVAWCSFVVLQGVEFETLYRDHGDHLTEIGRVANEVGSASGFAPPGDIHRVHNTGEITAVSVHVYGADLRDEASSVRREYDLPVRP